MPVIKSLEFIWNILPDRIEFKVQEPFHHKVCLFLNAPEFRRTQIKLQDWMEFCRKVNAPKDFVQRQIKFYNDLKKNKEKLMGQEFLYLYRMNKRFLQYSL